MTDEPVSDLERIVRWVIENDPMMFVRIQTLEDKAGMSIKDLEHLIDWLIEYDPRYANVKRITIN